MKRKPLILILIMCVLASILIVETNAVGSKNSFSDVKSSDWFFNDVQYVYEKGLMEGTSDTTFSPYLTTTRGMIVTVLWRLEGSPSASGSKFNDVKANQYYTKAVSWAAANEIVDGYGNGRFGPTDNITREQMAAVFFRYADYKGLDVTARAKLSGYKDSSSISGYAVECMAWANAVGLIDGTSSTTLSPSGSAERCQVAAMLKRYCEKVAVGGGQAPEKPENTPAANVATISINNVTASPGDKNVEVPIIVKNNPGILGMTLSVYYDEKVMTMTSAANGEAVNSVLTLTRGKSLSSGCRFVWDGVEITPAQTKDGTILLLRFSISDNASPGKYKVTVSYEDGDIVDNDLKTVSPAISNGQISVIN